MGAKKLWDKKRWSQVTAHCARVLCGEAGWFVGGRGFGEEDERAYRVAASRRGHRNDGGGLAAGRYYVLAVSIAWDGGQMKAAWEDAWGEGVWLQGEGEARWHVWKLQIRPPVCCVRRRATASCSVSEQLPGPGSRVSNLGDPECVSDPRQCHCHTVVSVWSIRLCIECRAVNGRVPAPARRRDQSRVPSYRCPMA